MGNKPLWRLRLSVAQDSTQAMLHEFEYIDRTIQGALAELIVNEEPSKEVCETILGSVLEMRTERAEFEEVQSDWHAWLPGSSYRLSLRRVRAETESQRIVSVVLQSVSGEGERAAVEAPSLSEAVIRMIAQLELNKEDTQRLARMFDDVAIEIAKGKEAGRLSDLQFMGTGAKLIYEVKEVE